MDGRLRVLYLVPNLHETGGAERFVLGLAQHLPRPRFAPVICTVRGASPAALRTLGELDIQHIDLDRRSRIDLQRFWPLIRSLREEPADILHAHMFTSNFWGSIIGRACRVPVVLAHEHTWSYKGNPLRVAIDGQVVGRLVDRFIAVSDVDAARMSSIEHVRREKVIVMPTAFIPRRKSAPVSLRADLGLPHDTPLVLIAVVLRRQKAVEVLLEAMSHLIRERPLAHLAIVGDGPERRFLEQRAEHLGLGSHVHFLGERLDVETALCDADVAALSSDYEGMPLYVLECMAAGTPLVATAVGRVPDLLDHGRAGVLVPPRDPLALAAGLRSLLDDPSRGAELARAASLRLHPFRIEKVAAQFAELYQDLHAEARR